MKVKVIEINQCQLKNILITIRPYLKDTWKIKLTVTINFVSHRETYEGRVMHSKNYNIEIMISDKADEVIEKLFNHFFAGIKLGWKHQRKVPISYLIVFVYHIINVIKLILNATDHILIFLIG